MSGQYTGHRRFDEESNRNSSLGRNEVHNELIGRPKLKQRENRNHQKTQSQAHIQQGYYSSNNYQLPFGQQLDHDQIYRTLIVEKPQQTEYQPFSEQQQDHQNRKVNFLDQHKTVVPELNFQQIKSPASNQGYGDTLDQYLTDRSSGNRYNSNQSKPSRGLLIQMQSDNQGNGDLKEYVSALPSGGLLTSRQNGAAKSTANLILNKQHEDQFLQEMVLNKTKQKSRIELSPVQDSSPNQVQRKIKDVQSTLTVGGLHAEETYLNKIHKNSIQKRSLFTINASTLPESGRYDVRESKAQVTRGLSLLPNRQLGGNHRQEIDEEILHREYTKLGGMHLGVLMPSEMNNMQYHRRNRIKDLTYNSMTGSYNLTKN